MLLEGISMQHWVDLHQALKKSKQVALVVEPTACPEPTKLEPLGERLWFKYTDLELYVTTKLVPNRSDSPIVIHQTPLSPFSATHFGLISYYPSALKPVAHAILIQRRQVGTIYPETITYGLAFIPIADFGYLRVLEPKDYEPIGPFWATIQLNWFFELFEQPLGGEDSKCK